MKRIWKLLGENPVYERWRWQIFAITWLAYAGFDLTRTPFSVAKIGMGEGTAIGLTQAQMAWIDGAFLVAYAAGQFFWGIAGDKFSTRKVVLTGIFGSVFIAFVMGSASSAMMLGVLYSLQGLCQASGWSPLLKNVSNFFSRRERGTILGLWFTNYALGGLAAMVFAGYVGQKFGWRLAFYIPAGTLLLIGLLFYRYQRDRPEDVGLPSIEDYHREGSFVIKPGHRPDEEREGSWQIIRDVVTSPMVFLLGLAYFCLKPVRYAILFWGPKYVNDRLGTGMAESGFLSAMFELAGPFSVLAAGLISDKLFRARRMPVSIICLVLLAGLLFFLDDLPRTRWMLAGSLFLLGLLTYAPEALISGIAPLDFGTKKGASTASGLINGLGSVGAIIGGIIPGFFHGEQGWHGVFTILSVAVLAAALLLLPKWNAVPLTPTQLASDNHLELAKS